MNSNALIHESSPYLLQHAHNPVDWYPWGEVALEKAKKENKPILVSIGYSACHWCHVMEKESFEDPETAAMMNKYFVCIKVDREERPDIDQLYMTAVQLITGRGGWPLNCFTLPDGRPFYGGTYFPRKNWQQVLNQLHSLYNDEFDKVEEYAENLTKGMRQTESFKITAASEKKIEKDDLRNAVNKWMEITDPDEGGPNKSPKFPLPCNYLFLLRYSALSNREDINDHVHLTLKKMAYGGIYDQIGGGFSRYSTDVFWKVPHFEKMLYDNAQLLSLYAEAWKDKPEEIYKETCLETADFLLREMKSPEGWFYSALDADSEGVEGLYYTWRTEEVRQTLNDKEYEIAEKYFNLNQSGYWEDGRYILLRKEDDIQIAGYFGIDLKEFKTIVGQIKSKLLSKREERVWPGLDNKMLTSWNGMLIRGFSDTYSVFGEEIHLKNAKGIAEFLLNNLMDENGQIWHTLKGGKPYLTGFLEDYCFLIDGLIALYEADFEEKWLQVAKDLCEQTVRDFYDPASGLFWFTSLRTPEHVMRQMETSDNVIPASNSVMARNLFYLGIWFSKPEWIEMSDIMLNKMRNDIIHYAPGYSNWAILALHKVFDYPELAVCGKDARENIRKIKNKYLPNMIVAAATFDSDLPFMQGRMQKETVFYVCRGDACEPPVYSISEAKKMLSSN